ncbi:LPXTG cell wall anchor domain-containing protein [Lactococcus garvieae]|uniref:LPXTG cell wall anchor domain-containing protein n=1 Tax=Lactococcus garvieae TaxID=1363 RepID=UPI0021B00429|nr:LPXTG cell wall anchor domain-containing protein [Lactococcus garvieae]
MIRRKTTHKVIRAAALGILLGANTKGVGNIIVKANSKRSDESSLIIPADLSAALENDFEYIFALQEKLQASQIQWSMDLEINYRDTIDLYLQELYLYNQKLSEFKAKVDYYQNAQNSLSKEELDILFDGLELDYEILKEAHAFILADYNLLNLIKEQRNQFFEGEDITSWILAQMGFDYESGLLYQVNYSYSPSEWRRIFEQAGNYNWTSKGHADIFDMSISLKGNPENSIPSFCAYLGSHHFAGEGTGNTGVGYLLDVNPFDNDFASQGGRDMTPEQYARIISAYNYLYDTFGQLDGNYRAITQVTTWMLLDDQFTFETIQEGEGGSLEVLDQNNHITSFGGLTQQEREIIEETLLAVNQGYQGKGQIYAFLYLVGVGEDGESLADPMQAQPQIVPIYTTDVPLIADYLPPEFVEFKSVRYNEPKEQEKKKEREKEIVVKKQEKKKDAPKELKEETPLPPLHVEVNPSAPSVQISEIKMNQLLAENQKVQELREALPETGEKDKNLVLIGAGTIGLTAVLMALYRKNEKNRFINKK